MYDYKILNIIIIQDVFDVKYITKSSLVDALLSVGIEKNDTVLVHSDIASFGTTENFSRKDALNIFYESFMEVLGSEGTLCVPAYFYEYARFGIPYDISLSPVSKELGVFSKFINSLPESIRSCNPLASVAAVGKYADYICEIKNRHNYGEDSAFNRLHKLNAKIVMLGTSLNAVTFGHYVEYHVGVPHMYNKIYNIPVLNNGEVIFDWSISSVRYLNADIEYGFLNEHEMKNISQIYIEKNIMKCQPYLENMIYVINTNSLYNAIANGLMINPYNNLAHTPNFPDGQIPNDGPTLKND